jgi:hypothetical protein
VKRHKSEHTDQIPAEVNQAEDHILCSEIMNILLVIWSKEALPKQWKEFTARIHTKGDKTVCNNYWGISLLWTTYQM